MKTYTDIKAEIEKLEQQAAKALKAEVTGVIDKIKDAIATYGLTAKDLGLGRAVANKRPATKKANGRDRTAVGVAKYRDPATGKTWTGRGKPPNWIVGVKNRDDYLIGASGEPANGAVAKKARKPRKAKGTGRAATRKTRQTRKGGRAPAKSAATQTASGAAPQ